MTLYKVGSIEFVMIKTVEVYNKSVSSKICKNHIDVET
jgi:hypothetical protein